MTTSVHSLNFYHNCMTSTFTSSPSPHQVSALTRRCPWPYCRTDYILRTHPVISVGESWKSCCGPSQKGTKSTRTYLKILPWYLNEQYPWRHSTHTNASFVRTLMRSSGKYTTISSREKFRDSLSPQYCRPYTDYMVNTPAQNHQGGIRQGPSKRLSHIK